MVRPERSAEMIVPCPGALGPTLDFFIALGFRLETISPADDPQLAVISGHGIRLRLDRDATGPAGALAIETTDAHEIGTRTAPNGTRVQLELAPALTLPPLEPVFTVTPPDTAWTDGRAGMRYRDLLPGRLGGRYAASHIRVDEAGPVADYVHHHGVRFQMIHCARGWVKLVYEDQGAPFILAAGDCVLQPPNIRHRVLECSAGLEVFEVSSPAEHDTFAEHVIELPTPATAPDREFDGQRFVRHQAENATWSQWQTGFERRDTRIGAGSGALAQVHVARCAGAGATATLAPAGELTLGIVLEGAVTLKRVDDDHRLERGAAFNLPAGTPATLTSCSANFELLLVTVAAPTA